MAEEVTIESLQAELAALKARNHELNQENAGHRLNAKNEKQRADDLAGKLEAASTAHNTALAELNGKLSEADKRASGAMLEAALKVAARDAGIRDLDGLKLLDTSKVKIGQDGKVEIPAKFFEDAKTAKPWLFGQESTSNPSPTPSPTPPKTKFALEMSPEEFAAARRRIDMGLSP